MPFDVEAESLRLLREGLPDIVRPMSQRHPYEPLSLIVNGQLAMALFSVRSRNRSWLSYSIMELGGTGPFVERTGRVGMDRREQRPASPRPGCAIAFQHLSGDKSIMWTIVQTTDEVTTAQALGQTIAVSRTGWLGLCWSTRRREKLELFDDAGSLLESRQLAFRRVPRRRWAWPRS